MPKTDTDTDTEESAKGTSSHALSCRWSRMRSWPLLERLIMWRTRCSGISLHFLLAPAVDR